MADSAEGVALPGRVELLGLLEALLPAGWIEAAERGDEDHVAELRESVDNPSIVRSLGEAGWTVPHYLPEHGGRGLTEHQARTALTLLVDLGVPHVPRGSGLPLAAPTIQQWSDDATKRRLLPPLVSGQERWCQLFSEPGAGSDMASLATSARRDGDEWVVNGQKVWTTYGHESQMAMLIARTDPDQPKHAGITYFALDMRVEGVDVRALINMAGDVEFNEVFLSDVRIPDLHRISPVGQGWAAAMTTLGAERVALSGVRKKRKASDEILGGKPYAEVEAEAAARGIRDNPAASDALMRRYIEGRVLAHTTQRARDARRAGQPAGPEGSISKIAKALGNQRLQETAIGIRGADAIAWGRDDEGAEDWVHQFLRTRGNSIEGGTSEIQRNIVGERVLGLPREPDPFKGAPWRDVPRS